MLYKLTRQNIDHTLQNRQIDRDSVLLTLESRSLTLRIFRLAFTAAVEGDLVGFSGDDLIFGETALFKKLPCVFLWGDGNPTIFGTNSCDSGYKNKMIYPLLA